jgi:hypothetical protein
MIGPALNTTLRAVFLSVPTAAIVALPAVAAEAPGRSLAFVSSTTRVLKVGPQEEYKSLALAAYFARAYDTIEIASGTYRECASSWRCSASA